MNEKDKLDIFENIDAKFIEEAEEKGKEAAEYLNSLFGGD